MMLNDVPLSVPVQEPVAVLVVPACVPSIEAVNWMGIATGVQVGGIAGGVAVGVGSVSGGVAVGVGPLTALHAPLSPAPISPSPFVSAASMHVVNAGQALPLHFAVDLTAHATFPLALVVMHGAAGGFGGRPQVETE